MIFLEHKALYNKIKDAGPIEAEVIPLGTARTARAGRDVTVVATMAMVHQAIDAAEHAGGRGDRARGDRPAQPGAAGYRRDPPIAGRTNRLIIVEEAPRTGGWGATIAALMQEEAFDSLDAPVTRVCLDDVPLPYSPPLEARALPDAGASRARCGDCSAVRREGDPT